MLNQSIKEFLENGTIEIALRTLAIPEYNNIADKMVDYYLSIFPHNVELLNKAVGIYFNTDKRKCYQCLRALKSTNWPLMKECMKYVENDWTYYNPEAVSRIRRELTYPKKNMITLTMTSCKRLNLFMSTVNSFINCCTDIRLIDRWVCIDDNSSQSDRDKMMELYPFIEFILKGADEKGHAISVNKLREMVTTPYVFHLEDDWTFIHKRDYLTDCLEILQASPKYGQCLINKNYAESHKQSDVIGGFAKSTLSGLEYVLHEYCDQVEFVKKYGNCPTSSYWPHFSLRPGLTRMRVYKEIGRFNPNATHFEMEYAHRYVSAGYSTVFLNGMYSIHTGRLTSERNDESKLNAYDLNQEKQFGAEPKPIKEQVREPEPIDPTIAPIAPVAPVAPIPINSNSRKVPDNMTSLKFMIFVLNMDRRADRWAKFNEMNKENIGSKMKYVRYPAIDGKMIKSTPQLQRIFDGNDYNMRKGMVGCAMSHIKLYTELVKSEYDFVCVLEDDAQLTTKFDEKFIKLITKAGKDWDIIYLGHHSYPKYRVESNYDRNNMDIKIEKWGRTKSLQESVGGTIGYLISRKGAENLLEFINKNGMTNGIDTVQQKSADVLNVYYSSPHLVYSDYCDGKAQVDTDIQFDYDSLSQSIEARFEEEIKFFENDEVYVIISENQMNKMIRDPKTENVLMYKNMDSSKIYDMQQNCLFPSYTLNNKVLVVVPKPTETHLQSRFFDRLKHNGEWSVSNAISMV
jgi:GR25 family glycosyltransferase involved in LPS biosynthesis